jgi:mannose-6-phosphate isomerase-like protein (cupin superfamily)
MSEQALTPVLFRYRTPTEDRKKQVVMLGRTDRMLGMVQILKEGGENNLHAHPHTDGMWIVLSGRVRFYGDDDILLGELGKHDGILIPRGCRYWFESSSEEPLEILAVQAFDVSLSDLKSIMEDRVNIAPIKTAPADVPIRSAQVEAG